MELVAGELNVLCDMLNVLVSETLTTDLYSPKAEPSEAAAVNSQSFILIALEFAMIKNDLDT